MLFKIIFIFLLAMALIGMIGKKAAADSTTVPACLHWRSRKVDTERAD